MYAEQAIGIGPDWLAADLALGRGWSTGPVTGCAAKSAGRSPGG